MRTLIFMLLACGLFWVPLPWGSNRLLSAHMLTAWFALTSALVFLNHVMQPASARSQTVVKLNALAIPAVLAALIMALLFAQTLSLPDDLHAWLNKSSLDHKTVVSDLIGAVAPGISVTVDTTLNECFRFGGYFLLFIATAWFCAANGKRDALCNVVLAAVAVQVALGFITSSFDIHFAPVITLDGHWSRMRGSFVNGNHFAMYVNFGAMILLARLLSNAGAITHRSDSARSNRRYISLALYTLALLVCVYVISRSGSRGAFAATLLSMAIGILFVLLRLGASAKKILLAAGVALAGVIAFTALSGSRLVTRIASGDVGLGERLDMWRIAIRGLSESWLTGFGAGSFETVFLSLRDGSLRTRLRYDNAHSDVVQTLFETGVLGLLLTVSFVVVIFFMMTKKYFATRNLDSQRILLCGILVCVCFSLSSLFEINYRVPANAVTFMTLLAIAFSVCLTGERVKRKTRSRAAKHA